MGQCPEQNGSWKPCGSGWAWGCRAWQPWEGTARHQAMLGIGAVWVKDRKPGTGLGSRNSGLLGILSTNTTASRQHEPPHAFRIVALHDTSGPSGDGRCSGCRAEPGATPPQLPHNVNAVNETTTYDPLRVRRIASPSRRGLSPWLRSPSGANLLATEVERVHAAVGNLFGYHCLQVGDLAGADLMGASRILGRTVVDIDGCAQRGLYPLAAGAATSLPVDSHAVDVVLLPHVLEFEMRPHDALREASRVLVPDGNVLILGFNPVSAIGLRRVFKHRAASAPWCGTYFGTARLRDWLTLLGFDIVDQRPCFAAGLARRDGRPDIRSFAEWMPPALASAALIVAKKRVNAVLPLRTRWKPRRRLAEVGLAGPSVRSASGG